MLIICTKTCRWNYNMN